jgi:hypothetical protein
MADKKNATTRILGRIYSFALFAAGLLFLQWPAALTLIGFWLEEILIFACTSVEYAVFLRRNPTERTPGGTGRFTYLFFFFAHFVFIAVFLVIDAQNNPRTAALLATVLGLFTGAGFLIDPAAGSGLLELAAGLLFWNVLDLLFSAFIGKRAGTMTLADIEWKTKTALMLPHLTIIAGGFALVMLKTPNWLAVGLIAGKLGIELLLAVASRPGSKS